MAQIWGESFRKSINQNGWRQQRSWIQVSVQSKKGKLRESCKKGEVRKMEGVVETGLLLDPWEEVVGRHRLWRLSCCCFCDYLIDTKEQNTNQFFSRGFFWYFSSCLFVIFPSSLTKMISPFLKHSRRRNKRNRRKRVKNLRGLNISKTRPTRCQN